MDRIIALSICSAVFSLGALNAAEKIITTYQEAARQILAIIACGILCRGTFISSAACGMASKPT